MGKEPKIPAPTIERLARYSRPLQDLIQNGSSVISSVKLAQLCGVNPAQVRKDLAYFGEFGTRGVGYEVHDLLHQIKRILGADQVWKLCIVGIGNLGNALVENDNFKKRGYRFVAAFDSHPNVIGRILPYGLTVEPMTHVKNRVQDLEVEIGVITTVPHEAQRISDLLIDAGVKAILNFAPVQVRTPECCIVENVDFSVRLENLAYHLAKIV